MKHIHEIKYEILCLDDSSDLKRGFHFCPGQVVMGWRFNFTLTQDLVHSALRLSLYNMPTIAFAVFKALETRQRITQVVCCCPCSGSNSKKQKQIAEPTEDRRYVSTSPENSKVNLVKQSSGNTENFSNSPPFCLSVFRPEMAIQFAFHFITFLLSLGIFSWIIKGREKAKAPDRGRLPPGPPKLPVIGHLHHIIGSLPHHYPLRNLASKYGPLMYLKFGEVSTIIVSSAEAAKVMLKTHDLACAERPKSVATQVMWYNYSDIVFSPYGDYWRQMRKICILELLSAKNVRSFEYIRKDEASLLTPLIQSTCGVPFDLTEKIFLFMNSMTCRAVFGNASMDRAAAIKLIKKAFGLAGHFDLADLFPSIKLFDFISWNKFKLLKMQKKLDKILDNVIDEHRKNRDLTKKGYGELGTEDLVDVLLRLKEGGELDLPITNDNIKAVIFDMFASGTESSSTIVDWAMAELMKNPGVMAKAQDEIRQAFSGRKTIKDSEIRTLKYLKLVINETLRLHPPVSIIPRASREEFETDGYHIPLNVNIIVNIWSIGRDPNYWQNPESFEPERFEKNPIDFLGSHFEYIPFGSGKRICPGMTFGVANVEFLLAQLLYHFDWKLPPGITPDDLDMTEVDGITVSRKSSLRLIAEPYDPAPGNDV